MKLIRSTTWDEIFKGWEEREANNPGWIKCATEIKGWPDWQSWRGFTAEQMHAKERKWQIFKFSDPLDEIPEMLVGPFNGWQGGLISKNKISFIELLKIPEKYQKFANHKGVLDIMNAFPFSTEFIGLWREDLGKIVCMEGHHRATAIALAKLQNKQIDFSNVEVTIAMARVEKDERDLFDQILARGTSKIKNA